MKKENQGCLKGNADPLDFILSLRTSEPRAFNASVAEKVMGQPTFHDKRGYYYLKGEYGLLGNLSPAEYHSSAEADYTVLCHVREQWTVERQERFRELLGGIYHQRGLCPGNPRGYKVATLLAYLPGDWATCAWATIEEGR